MFLIDAKADAAGKLESQLSDYGFDVISTADRVAGYHRVENTYLATFRSLGALGLLLGTIGLAAVLLRNVLERRRELALLRAVGYRPEHLQRLVLAENAFLLLTGIGIGAICSAVAVAPAWLERGGQIPILSILSLLTIVAAAGLLSSWIAARSVARSPLLAALRSE
jgi:ABC-type antimicrobial peptide transport system permease subunit